ncbi:MAG: GHKL domain-containing protein [Oscillospiraceae bacterium]|nr:GHKL domain-containing protein [Oscillospiraceae bacterium]
MFFAELLLNAVCVFPACVVALQWIGIPLRRTISIAAITTGLSLCTNIISAYYLQDFPSTLILLLIVLPISLMNPKVSFCDACAVVTLSSAAYSVTAFAVRVMLSIAFISDFFQIALAVLFLFIHSALSYNLRPLFPGSNWSNDLEDQLESSFFSRRSTQYCAMLGVYWIACILPLIAGLQGAVILIILLVLQLGGLVLLSILLENHRYRFSLALQQQTNDELQTFMNIVRSQRHDYNIHVQTLHELVRQERQSEATDYLNRLMEDTVALNRLLPLADAAVSAVILSFQSEAARMGIPMNISIENDLSNISTNTYETNKIIGNLLQNALDETAQLKDKSFGIHLSVIKRGEYAVIRVSNRTQNDNAMKDYRIGQSSKSGHEGIGIASIRALATRYGGVVYARQEDRIIHFVAKIPLCLGREE